MGQRRDKSTGGGLVEWYGKNGKTTASGEKFDEKALTAAHKDLPFGTIITVTNSGNGKKVDVKINDRGPADKDRILALSKAAFSAVEDLDKCLFKGTFRKYS